jgi:hypothetical protein
LLPMIVNLDPLPWGADGQHGPNVAPFPMTHAIPSPPIVEEKTHDSI